MDRIFTSLEIKSVNEERREIEGWASTGSRDRAGDRLDPFGCQFDLSERPIPFLMDHDAKSVVGQVVAAEVSAKGVYFRAKLPKITEPGKAKDQVDYAFHALKHGLRKSVSVGFVPLEFEPLPDGGYFYKAWDWMELSAVAVPCQPEAQVVSVRHAPGKGDAPRGHVLRLTPRDLLVGKLHAESERRAAIRKRLGIPSPVIRLRATDYVEARLRAAREERRAKVARTRRGGVVRLR